MKTTISLHDFREAFCAMRPDNFSYEGLEVLFDYCEQYEQDIGEEIELDVISLCCDFSEDTVEIIAEQYSIDLNDCSGDYYEISEKVKNYLDENGAFIGETSTGFVYRQF